MSASNQTRFAVVLTSTKGEPDVLDVPPAPERTSIFGSAIDISREPLADIGPAGSDEGKAGRYLFLPPGYQGEPHLHAALFMDARSFSNHWAN
jgi:hypothetical protein